MKHALERSREEISVELNSLTFDMDDGKPRIWNAERQQATRSARAERPRQPTAGNGTMETPRGETVSGSLHDSAAAPGDAQASHRA